MSCIKKMASYSFEKSIQKLETFLLLSVSRERGIKNNSNIHISSLNLDSSFTLLGISSQF